MKLSTPAFALLLLLFGTGSAREGSETSVSVVSGEEKKAFIQKFDSLLQDFQELELEKKSCRKKCKNKKAKRKHKCIKRCRRKRKRQRRAKKKKAAEKLATPAES